jgi:hypothetical protein
MRVLDLLKSYADKGVEPPAAVAEPFGSAQ